MKKLMFVGLFAAMFLSGVALASDGAGHSIVCEFLRSLQLQGFAVKVVGDVFGCDLGCVPPAC